MFSVSCMLEFGCVIDGLAVAGRNAKDSSIWTWVHSRRAVLSSHAISVVRCLRIVKCEPKCYAVLFSVINNVGKLHNGWNVRQQQRSVYKGRAIVYF